MPRMPIDHCEMQFDAMPDVSMREYLTHFHVKNGLGPLPPLDHKVGTVKAVLNHGLWIVRCPMGDGCYGEVAANNLEPIFCCVDCGAGWFDVEFPHPDMIARIEAEVEKRPKTRVGMPHANWLPGETLAELREATRLGRDV